MVCGAEKPRRVSALTKSLPGPHDTMELLHFAEWLDEKQDKSHCFMLLFLKQYLQGPADVIAPTDIVPFLYEQLIFRFSWPKPATRLLEVDDISLQQWKQARNVLYGKLPSAEMPATCGKVADDSNRNAPKRYQEQFIPQYRTAAEILLRKPLDRAVHHLQSAYKSYCSSRRFTETEVDPMLPNGPVTSRPTHISETTYLVRDSSDRCGKRTHGYYFVHT